MTVQMPDAVFWDWDGTLVDSYSFLNDAHSHTLEALGFEPLKEGEYKQYFGKPREVLYTKIYGDKSEPAKDIFRKYVTENAHSIQMIDDACQVLEFFKQKNILMGIVSNKTRDLIALEADHLKLRDYFSIILGAGEAEADKPSPAPLLMALERSGLDHKTQNIWYIGDTENDLLCARNVGCDALLFKGHQDTERLIKDYAPLFSYATYPELKEFLVAL